MKKILITGKNSYIGTSLEKWLLKTPNKYTVDSISVKETTWKTKNFSSYDTIVHVAGIAHVKEKNSNKNLYFQINRDLSFEIAKKAKEEGVKQFIFLSTMSVYGLEKGTINENTPVNPKNSYGKSKMEAENLIGSLRDSSFAVAFIRPPMVYGKGCKGNYPKLAKLALKSPVFPMIDNKRSMIYINNLSEFIKCLIDEGNSGVFHPQNNEYVNTSELVQLISEANGKKIIITRIISPLFKTTKVHILNKLFGSLIYEEKISSLKKGYIVSSFRDSILQTEGLNDE